LGADHLPIAYRWASTVHRRGAQERGRRVRRDPL